MADTLSANIALVLAGMCMLLGLAIIAVIFGQHELTRWRSNRSHRGVIGAPEGLVYPFVRVSDDDKIWEDV